MTHYFDTISLIASLMCAKTLWQLLQNWSDFWDAQVTWRDRELAQQLAVFVLIPFGVLLHEIGRVETEQGQNEFQIVPVENHLIFHRAVLFQWLIVKF